MVLHNVKRLLAVSGVTVLALSATVGVAWASPSSGTFYVASSGSDAGQCSHRMPCATIQRAINVASANSTIRVGAGVYHQVVNVNKPLTVRGAGAGASIIDGSNLDLNAATDFAVVGLTNSSGPAGGQITFAGFTVRNAFITQAEYVLDQEPTELAIGDLNASDSVTVSDNVFLANQDTANFDGVGIYSLNSLSRINVSDNGVSGMFSGIFMEGTRGPVSVTGNTISHLLADTGVGGPYYPQGIWILADTAGTSTATVDDNTMYGYRGWGVIGEAGYAGGNCAPPNNVCTGNINIAVTDNSFALQGASNTAAIEFKALPGNSLTATATDNDGTVQRPGHTIYTPAGGGILHVTQFDNDIELT